MTFKQTDDLDDLFAYPVGVIQQTASSNGHKSDAGNLPEGAIRVLRNAQNQITGYVMANGSVQKISTNGNAVALEVPIQIEPANGTPIAPILPKPSPDKDEMRRACKLLTSGVVEIRAFMRSDEKTRSGYYNNEDALIEDTFSLSQKETTPNTYWTLQEIKPEIFDQQTATRQNNCDQKVFNTTGDNDVLNFRWLPFDFDPLRPNKSKSNSTNEEKAKALNVALDVRKFLADLGIQSILADSGNGYHLLIKVLLPVTSEFRELIRVIIDLTGQVFSNDGVNFDTSVFNPSRIWKAYGSVARKGEHMEERPWRTARILDVPANLDTPFDKLYLLKTELQRRVAVPQAVPDSGSSTSEKTEIVMDPEKRNVSLTRVAGRLRYEGLNAPEIEAKLKEENLKHFGDDPLPDDEIHTIANSIAKKPTGAEERETNKVLIAGKPAGTVGSTPAAVPPASNQPEIVLESFADGDMMVQEFIWPGHIPLGALTLFAGNPDVGKTTAALDFIARVTQGFDWPDGAVNEFDISDVLLCEAEDDKDATIRPNLHVAAEERGADMHRVHGLKIRIQGNSQKRAIQLDMDLQTLEAAILTRQQHGQNIRLLVFSPLSAYLGYGVKSIDDGAIRAILTPLQEMAARLQIAVVGIIHLNKQSDYDVIYRVSGAMGFVAIARASWLFAKDSRNKKEDKRIMLPIKGNLTAKQKGLEYTIEASESKISKWHRTKKRYVAESSPLVIWGKSTEVSADEIMKEAKPGRKVGDTGAAQAILFRMFCDSAGKFTGAPVSKFDYNKNLRAAAAQGMKFSERLLRTAKQELGVDWNPKTQQFVIDPKSAERFQPAERINLDSLVEPVQAAQEGE